MISNGDHALNINGRPYYIDDADEILQRAVIRLGIKKGRFAYDPTLGSELYKLTGPVTESLKKTAYSYVTEALLPIPQITVESVSCQAFGTDSLKVTAALKYKDRQYTIEV